MNKFKEFINKPLTNEMVKSRVDKIKDFELDLDKNIDSIKKNAKELANKNIKLDFLQQLTRKIYMNPVYVGILELLQFIIFVCLIYFYNPLDINTNYPVFTKLLIAVVGFIYVVLFFFIKIQVENGNDVDLIEPTESTIIIKLIATVIFFIVLALTIKGIIWIFLNTSIVNVLRHGLTTLMVFGFIGIAYLFMKKTINKAQESSNKNTWVSFMFKFVMYLPCLMVDIVEYIKLQFNLTTKPVWILLGMEAGFVGLWLILPFLFEKVTNYNGLKLITQPVFLNTENIIGNFEQLYKNKHTLIDNDNSNIDQLYSNKMNSSDLTDEKDNEENNYTNPNIPTNPILAWFYNKAMNLPSISIKTSKHPQYSDYNSKRFKYTYALSAWFNINPQPPNTSGAYTKYTNILKYGDKVKVEYNGKLRSLRVIASIASDTNDTKNKLVTVYKTTNVLYQKWNNIVINYDNGYIDVFINGDLVGSRSGVVPYMSFDDIVIGENNGIHGGICNVTYYDTILSKRNIGLLYKALRDKNIPYIGGIKDETKNNKSFLENIKQTFAIK